MGDTNIPLWKGLAAMVIAGAYCVGLALLWEFAWPVLVVFSVIVWTLIIIGALWPDLRRFAALRTSRRSR